jgi:hypothetical protein
MVMTNKKWFNKKKASRHFRPAHRNRSIEHGRRVPAPASRP